MSDFSDKNDKCYFWTTKSTRLNILSLSRLKNRFSWITRIGAVEQRAAALERHLDPFFALIYIIVEIFNDSNS